MAGTREPQTLAPGVSNTAANTTPDPKPLATERQMADAIRALSIDAVGAAGSGCSATAVAMAGAAAVLWTRFLRFDAADPRWPDRDRFVLAAGHGSMLLYALLHLTGHAGMEIAALRRFRQLDSAAAGYPEFGEHPAIETTTGPPGQGLATAVGMALAERILAARFGRSLVDHRTWVLACTADLVHGISHETGSLAGHLRLEKLTILWHDDAATRAAPDGAPGSDDPLKRFASYGWATKRVDADDQAAIASALSFAMRSKKPTLIACAANPAPAETPDDATASMARDALDWAHPPFDIPEPLAERWRSAGRRAAPARRAWLKRLTNHPMRAEFDRAVAGRLPETWHEATGALKLELAETRPTQSTSRSSRMTMQVLADAIPDLLGADAAPGTAPPRGMAAIAPGMFAGRHIRFGPREHAMAAAMNGTALHGGLLPTATAPFVFTDAMRPALRMAALMHQRVIHELTHDSIGLGEDGPTYQPVEHLASVRAMPGMVVLRPADAVETVECWELAIRRTDGPSVLVLSQQDVAAVRSDAGENRSARGGYVLAEADGPRQATLIASGSEVATALEARRLLNEAGIPAAVVSLPCWELFAGQDDGYRAGVLGAALRVGIEAACGFGWERWLGPDGIFIGMTSFGASAPADTLFRHFGITPDAITAAVRKRVASSQPEGN